MIAQGTLQDFIRDDEVPPDLRFDPKDNADDRQLPSEEVDCMICNRKFPAMNSLQNHIRSHNIGWYDYHDLVDTGMLEKYLEENEESVIRDPQQHREMKKSDNQARRGRPSPENQLKNTLFCPVCKNSYKSLGSLRAHIRQKHPREENDMM